MSAIGRGQSSRSSPDPNDSRSSVFRPESVFISYSPKDAKHLEMLMRHLRLLKNQNIIRVFTHAALPVGALWQQEVEIEISNAAAAILLVTPDYLESDDLMENQVPRLLARAEEQGGTLILPLLVAPSLFETLPHLFRFKPFNDPSKTLVEMARPGEKDRFLVTVAQAVQEAIRHRQAGSAGDMRL